jgi:transcriptional regulator with XRE-family HTH domain
MSKEDSDKTAARLGEYVKARREQLELTQAEAAQAAAVGLSTYQKIEYGYQSNPSRDTRRGLEAALRWAPGSIQAITAGGEPNELDPEADSGNTAATAPSDARPKPTITTTDEAGNVIPGPVTDASGLDLAELHRNIKEVAEALRRIDERLDEQDRRPGVGDRM